MIVALDTLYHSRLLFQPARDATGCLHSLDLVTQFNGVNAPVSIPVSLIIPCLTIEQQLTLLDEQLMLLENNLLFFFGQNITVRLAINDSVARHMMSDITLMQRIKALPFLILVINENFPDLNSGRENRLIRELAHQYPLALGNYGAGIITTRPVFDGLFRQVILDRFFIRKQILSSSFCPFMRAIIDQVGSSCQTLIVDGIDTDSQYDKVLSLGFQAIKGNLWPVQPPGQLASLLKDIVPLPGQ